MFWQILNKYDVGSILDSDHSDHDHSFCFSIKCQYDFLFKGEKKIKKILVEKSLGFLKRNYTNLRISDVESAESKGVFDLNSILLKLFTTYNIPWLYGIGLIYDV